MDIKDLPLNERINFRGLLAAWTDIAVDRWQQELQQKLYSRSNRRTRRGWQSTRTGRLHAAWQSQTSLSGGNGRVRISFLQYGRFVDMGVGRGVDYAQAVYARSRKNGEKLSRKPIRWYSRRKGYEIHRLRELLTRFHLNVPLDLLENALTTRVTIDI